MPGHTPSPPRGADHRSFVCAAARYWTGVFPLACREIGTYERDAQIIPDTDLRAIALAALREERGNLEGAAAYATFAPRRHRLRVARASIAFQAVYDFVDAISERRGSHIDSTRRLHQALLVALDPGASHVDYYAHSHLEDGGYLRRLVERCQTALDRLPSLATVSDQTRLAANRILAYQCLNHQGPTDSWEAFARWADSQATHTTDLKWWETGAAAGSSLSIFALISAAADAALQAEHAAALEHAYFPWIGALHTLLDSLVDEHEDAIAGQHCLTARYGSRAEAAERLRKLTAKAVEQAKALPKAEDHTMILAAMIGFYLADRHGLNSHAQLPANQVLQACGEHALPAMLVMRSRHTARRLARPRNHRNTSES